MSDHCPDPTCYVAMPHRHYTATEMARECACDDDCACCDRAEKAEARAAAAESRERELADNLRWGLLQLDEKTGQHAAALRERDEARAERDAEWMAHERTREKVASLEAGVQRLINAISAHKEAAAFSRGHNYQFDEELWREGLKR